MLWFLTVLTSFDCWTIKKLNYIKKKIITGSEYDDDIKLTWYPNIDKLVKNLNLYQPIITIIIFLYELFYDLLLKYNLVINNFIGPINNKNAKTFAY